MENRTFSRRWDSFSDIFRGKWAVMVLLAIMATGCSSNMVLDNPRSEAVVFTIDGDQEYEVAAGETQSFSLDPGTHKVEIATVSGTVIGDTTFNLKEAGLIHSGASTYVVWRQLYGLQTDRKTLLNERWVEFDSVKTFGDFKVYQPSWYFIENSWDYGLDDELPDAQSLYITSDFKLESKIFRSRDFIEKYRELQSKREE